MNKGDLDRHITGDYGERPFRDEATEKLRSFREYMGPSANGMSDKKLKALAGWTSFEAGWDYAVCKEVNSDE